MILCGLDVGGSGTKCGVFRDDGSRIAFSRQEYDMRFQDGRYEIDAERIWSAVKRALVDVSSKISEPIDAICVSALGEACVPLSSDDKILAPAILFHDPRGREEAAQLKSKMGNDWLYETTGSVANGSFSIEKLAWIKNNEPYFERISKFLPMEAFVIHMLTGEQALSFTSAARTLAFDIKGKRWHPGIFEALGLDSKYFPNLYPSGEIVGTVGRKVACELGLQGHVRVVTGGHDMWCCTVGCGVLDSSKAANVAGGCESLNYVRPTLDTSPFMMEHNYYWTPFVKDGLYGTYSVCLSAGSVLKWLKTNFFGDWEKNHGESFYRCMDARILGPPSRVVVVPSFSSMGSPLFSTNSSGLIDGLKLDTTPLEIYRGIMEGITYSLKENVENMAKAGMETREIRSTGGGAGSAVWAQIKADVLSARVEVVSGHEAGTVGCAMMAGIAVGAYRSYEEAADRMVKIDAVYEPDGKYEKEYAENYSRFLELRKIIRTFD